MRKMNKKKLPTNVSAPNIRFKVTYPTTSALTYPITSKADICGMVGKIFKLSKKVNASLQEFTESIFNTVIQVPYSISLKRFHINWSASPGHIKGRKLILVFPFYKMKPTLYISNNE